VWRKDVDRLWHRGEKGEKSRGGAALGVHHALWLAVHVPPWCVREGERGEVVTRLMAPPQPMANGLAVAQEGGVPMPSADGNGGGSSVLPSLGRN